MKREYRQLRTSQLDRSLGIARSLPPRPSGGWIAAVREALGLSQRQVGKKMRATGQAIQQFEKAEAEGRITLRALRRVAGTMGCEVVYTLVPRAGSFAELAEQPTRERTAGDVKSVIHSMASRPSLAYTPGLRCALEHKAWRNSPRLVRSCAKIAKVPTRGGCYMRRNLALLFVCLLLPSMVLAAGQTREEKRLEASGQVLKEILNIPDGIPKSLLDKAECVIVIPTMLKFAIGVGGDFGRGAITCRTGEHFTGPWSAPALIALEGGNLGFQLGGQATDFVLLVMNPKGADSILTSKVKLGADAAAAVGPKGRDAAADTDVVMKAEVLSYSRSRGLFAGISLEGSTLRSDGSANKKLYGRDLTAKNIVREGKVGVPASGRDLVSLLNQKSPRNRSDAKSLQ